MSSIAIVGEFASGKTTLANALISDWGYRRISFAANLKRVAAAVYEAPGEVVDKSGQYPVWPLDEHSETTASGREILQRLGQAVKELDRLFWIRWLMNEVDAGEHGSGPFVIDDCRFPYEASALRERGFVVARVVTPLDIRMERYENSYGRRPTIAEMNHPSETEVQNIRWDFVLDGTQPVESLTLQAIALARSRAA